MAAKKLDAKALKEKKQKKIAAVLLVVLLAAMAFSIPKTMKMMNQSSAVAAPPPAETTPAPAPVDGAAAGALPAPGSAPVDAAAGAAAVAAAGTPAVTGVAAADPSAGLLVSFERFESKDPFEQQIRVGNGPAGSAPSAPDDGDADKAPEPVSGFTPSGGSSGEDGAPALPTDSGTTASTDPGTTGEGASTTTPTTTTPTAPAGNPTQASISVNGAVAETVALEGAFPTSEPLFQLVEVSKTGAKIAIVDGGYENGAKAITLTVGKTLTLMNTADGTKYEIRLVSVG